MLEDIKLFVLIYIPTLLVMSLWFKTRNKAEKKVVVKARVKRKKR